jgi:hypothetical protein
LKSGEIFSQKNFNCESYKEFFLRFFKANFAIF